MDRVSLDVRGALTGLLDRLRRRGGGTPRRGVDRDHGVTSSEEPELRIDVGPAVSVGALRALAVVAGAAAVLLTATTVTGWVLGLVALALAVARPRGALPAFWLGVVGLALLLQDERPTVWLALSTALTVLAVHVTCAALRLTENLGRRAPVAVAVLRRRWPTFWRAQLVGQGLGLVAWAVPELPGAWVTAAAVLGVGVLGWLLLVPPRRVAQ